MNLPDLRPQLAASQEWVASLIEGIDPAQLDDPTPCQDWTVRELIQHLMAVEGRVAGLPRLGSVDDLPRSLPLPEGDLADGFRQAATEAQQAWAEDSLLTQTVTPPWGPVPGAAAIGGYLNEHLTHGWDLATATGQDAEADPNLVEPVLAMTRNAIPDLDRGTAHMPFAAVVESTPDAGPTEQLANWLGRRSR